MVHIGEIKHVQLKPKFASKCFTCSEKTMLMLLMTELKVMDQSFSSPTFSPHQVGSN
jgi:hypothetical protein